MSKEIMQIEIDQAMLTAIEIKLKNLRKQTPRVLRNSINRTATETLRKIKKGRSAGYTIKAGEFNKEIKVQRASASHLDATIKAKGPVRTIKNFKTKDTKAGIKTDITKTGLKSLVNDAGAKVFIATGGKVNGLYVQRETKDRYPLRVLHANSVPKMVKKIYEGKRGDQGEMEDFIKKTLTKNISRQIDKILGGK